MPLRYLQEQLEGSNALSSAILPKSAKIDITDSPHKQNANSVHFENIWHTKKDTIPASLHALIRERLQSYRMSPTHLNTFIDLEYGGPQIFLEQTILRFPQAPTEDGEYGNAIHETLEWYHKQKAAKEEPTPKEIEKMYISFLHQKYIARERMAQFERRGTSALNAYIQARGDSISGDDLSEYDFRSDSVHLDEVLLTGKIDRLKLHPDSKEITVFDYKTGESFDSWNTSTLKVLKYRQQLYMYKLLVEQSPRFQGYRVTEGVLEFIEPDRDGEMKHLRVTFDDTEFEQTKRLIRIVYSMIVNFTLPTTRSLRVVLVGASCLYRISLNKKLPLDVKRGVHPCTRRELLLFRGCALFRSCFFLWSCLFCCRLCCRCSRCGYYCFSFYGSVHLIAKGGFIEPHTNDGTDNWPCKVCPIASIFWSESKRDCDCWVDDSSKRYKATNTSTDEQTRTDYSRAELTFSFLYTAAAIAKAKIAVPIISATKIFQSTLLFEV